MSESEESKPEEKASEIKQQKPVKQKIEKPKGPGFFSRIKNRFFGYKRVLSVARKPDKKEFLLSSKITGSGIIFVGLIGFAIFLIYFLLKTFLVGV